MQPDTLDRVIHILIQVSMLAGALITAGLPLFPFLLPVISGWIKDEKQRQAFDAVSRAGLLAASAASSEFRKLLSEAKLPGSVGGATVTDEEKRVILAKATAIGVEALRRGGMLQSTETAYGGNDAVKASVESIAHHQLFGRTAPLANGVGHAGDHAGGHAGDVGEATTVPTK